MRLTSKVMILVDYQGRQYPQAASLADQITELIQARNEGLAPPEQEDKENQFKNSLMQHKIDCSRP
jgi:hypothetical protein